MQGSERTKVGPALIVLAVAGGLGACNTASPVLTTGSIPDRKPPMVVSDAERDCLGRAMYFESNRSDSDGLVAVGTVVMNRLENAVFPGGICAVVGQPGQFAPGVLTSIEPPRAPGAAARAHSGPVNSATRAARSAARFSPATRV